MVSDRVPPPTHTQLTTDLTTEYDIVTVKFESSLKQNIVQRLIN